ACSGVRGVDNSLNISTWPSRTTMKSVKVPPVSIPIRSFRIRNRVWLRPELVLLQWYSRPGKCNRERAARPALEHPAKHLPGDVWQPHVPTRHRLPAAGKLRVL